MVMTLESVPVEKVSPIDISKIDPQANYRCRLQVGARQRWRSYRGGKFTMKKNDQNSKQIEFVHFPAVHITAPLKGETVIGLAVEQNDWLDANRTKASLSGTDSTIERSNTMNPVQTRNGHAVYKGDVARQLLITMFEETTDPSEDNRVFLNPWDQMRQMFAEGIKDVLSSILSARDEFSQSTGKSKSKNSD